MEEGKRVFWILLGVLLFTFLLLSFMSYKYYSCKCYEGQSLLEWSSQFMCSSDSGYTRSCTSWSDSGMAFGIFILLFILSVGLLGLIIFVILKFFRAGLPRPDLSEKQKGKTAKQLKILQNLYKTEGVFCIITIIISLYFALKMLFYMGVGYSLLLLIALLVLMFIAYKNYRWFIKFYDSLIKKLKK